MKINEQRKSAREECLVPVDGREGDAFENLYTIDISPGGLGFISRKPIPVHKKIAVELELGFNKEPVLMMAEVQWVKSFQEKRLYRVGMKFIKVLFSGSKSRLTQYLGR